MSGLAAWSRSRRAPVGAAAPLLSSSQVLRIKSGLAVRTADQYRAASHRVLLWFLLSTWAIHLMWCLIRFRGSQVLLPALQVLSGVGLLHLISVVDPLRDSLQVRESALGIVMGALLLVVASLLPYERLFSRVWALPAILAVGLGVLLVCFGSGPSGSHVKVNLTLGGIQFQPSELVLVLLCFSLAGYFARYYPHLRGSGTGVRWMGMGMRFARFSDVIPVAVAMAMAMALFLIQHDNGPALVLGATFAGVYTVARGRWRLAACSLAACVAAAGVILRRYPALFPTVADRVAIWLYQWDNTVRNGDQLAHSFFAFAAAGWMGQGPGLSLAASVPNVANDAVACGIAETFGFLGFLAVYGLLGLLAMNGFRIARAAATPYQFLLAFGLTLAQSLQALIVTAGILGLIPLTGVSTPLLSTGRTGMLVAFATVGVLASVSARARNGEAAAPFHAPAGHLTAALAAGLALIFVAGGCYALVHPRDTSLRVARTRTHRLNPAAEEPELQEVRNPRLAAMARLLRRGSIYSADGVAVATSSLARLRRRRRMSPNCSARAGASSIPPTGGTTRWATCWSTWWATCAIPNSRRMNVRSRTVSTSRCAVGKAKPNSCPCCIRVLSAITRKCTPSWLATATSISRWTPACRMP